MVRTSLAPGFRFHPTDDELILYYLKRKILGKKFHYEAIAEVNIYKYSPWDLPDKSLLKTKDLEWFFFCPREKKYASGARVKRATKNGFWKTTGNERNIYWNTKTVGTVRTLIFHLGHAPKGERTNWVIYEYKILDDQLAEAGVQDNYVLCKVFEKKGAGPKNGAQYGAPFNEADWADDEDDNVARDCVLPLADDGQYPTVPIQNEEQHLPLETGLCGSGNGSLPIPAEGTSASAVVSASMIAADETTDDTMRRLLGLFVPENGNGHNQVDLTDSGKKKLLPLEGLDIYDDLRDLDCWSQMEEDIFDFSGAQNFDDPLTSSLSKDNANYIELDDLQHPLDCSNEANGTHSSLLCQTSASYSHESMQQWYSDTRFSGMNQYNSFSTNDLAIRPYTYEGGDSLAALQMLNPQHYQGSNASYYFDSPIWHLENAVCTPDNMMERGSHLEKSYSRFVECIPPSAAELLALSLSTYGGSSIHIKAEVNHGAGECTNEALSVMMGGSSSCWCILIFRKIQIRLWVIEGLLDVVEFISALIVVCCLNDTISWIYHDYHINDIYHIHQDNQNRLILFCISSFAIFFRSYALFNILLLAFLPLLATDKASYLLGLSSNSFCLFVDSLQFPTICLIKTKVTGLVGS